MREEVGSVGAGGGNSAGAPGGSGSGGPLAADRNSSSGGLGPSAGPGHGGHGAGCGPGRGSDPGLEPHTPEDDDFDEAYELREAVEFLSRAVSCIEALLRKEVQLRPVSSSCESRDATAAGAGAGAGVTDDDSQHPPVHSVAATVAAAALKSADHNKISASPTAAAPAAAILTAASTVTVDSSSVPVISFGNFEGTPLVGLDGSLQLPTPTGENTDRNLEHERDNTQDDGRVADNCNEEEEEEDNIDGDDTIVQSLAVQLTGVMHKQFQASLLLVVGHLKSAKIGEAVAGLHSLVPCCRLWTQLKAALVRRSQARARRSVVGWLGGWLCW